MPLAAERTVLAWVRTGLALMGFRFVVARFGVFLLEVAAIHPSTPPSAEGACVWIGAGMVALGAAVNVLVAVSHVRLFRLLGGGARIGRPSGLSALSRPWPWPPSENR